MRNKSNNTSASTSNELSPPPLTLTIGQWKFFWDVTVEKYFTSIASQEPDRVVSHLEASLNGYTLGKSPLNKIIRFEASPGEGRVYLEGCKNISSKGAALAWHTKDMPLETEKPEQTKTHQPPRKHQSAKSIRPQRKRKAPEIPSVAAEEPSSTPTAPHRKWTHTTPQNIQETGEKLPVRRSERLRKKSWIEPSPETPESNAPTAEGAPEQNSISSSAPLSDGTNLFPWATMPQAVNPFLPTLVTAQSANMPPLPLDLFPSSPEDGAISFMEDSDGLGTQTTAPEEGESLPSFQETDWAELLQETDWADRILEEMLGGPQGRSFS